MTCYFPLDAYRIVDKYNNVSISFSYRDRFKGTLLKLPCGRCRGCRLERSKQWATRCMHEASLHSDNCFLTITYSDEFLPSPPSLSLRDLQLFMKRLRKRVGTKLRFFQCGEYGEQKLRPHYHSCIFGWRPNDLVFHKVSNGNKLYTSKLLSEVWGKGFVLVGDVTFESAAYVARYIMKKVNGDDAEVHYTRVDPLTGEIYEALPEFITMSRRPGIASGWFEKYSSDVFPSDSVILRGREVRPPRFYQDRLKLVDPFLYDEVLFSREEKMKNYIDDYTERRLNDRLEVLEARLSKLPRNLE